MSRSHNTELKNPSTRFYQWSGDNGNLNYFDKELGEKGQKWEEIMHLSAPM